MLYKGQGENTSYRENVSWGDSSFRSALSKCRHSGEVALWQLHGARTLRNNLRVISRDGCRFPVQGKIDAYSPSVLIYDDFLTGLY